jgi:hypothetical protein
MQQYLAYFKENFLMINGKVSHFLWFIRILAWFWQDIPWATYCSNESHQPQKDKGNVFGAFSPGTDFLIEDLVLWCHS